MSDLVTGEAVPLELRLAKLPTRSLAVAIDLAILFGTFILVLGALGPVMDSLDSAAQAAIGLTATVVVFVGIQTTVETLTRGKSAGKAALGLRVVRDDGGPIRFRHALARWLAAVFVDFVVFGTVAIICSLLNERGKRVGDILAGTVVVRERTPATIAALPPVPQHLAWWAAQADIGQVPDGLSVAARNYLSRARELRPQVRDAMGNQLARDMSAYVSPHPPQGTPAWAYLAAVLGERHRREMQRIAPPPADSSSTPPATEQPSDPPPQQPGRDDSPQSGFAPPS